MIKQKQNISDFLDLLLALSGILILISFVLEHGFYLSDNYIKILEITDIFIFSYFILQHFIKISFAEKKREFIKYHWFDSTIIFLILVELLVFVEVTGIKEIEKAISSGRIITLIKSWILIAQILILSKFVVKTNRLNRWVSTLNLYPAQVLILSFLIIITIGTGLLMLPKASIQHQSLPFINALFTATSATCVTGLVLVDTGQYFSLFGQIIILLLIQIGGLGLMTFSSFFVFLFRRNISLQEKTMVKELMNYEMVGTVVQVLKFSIIITFTLEFIGAVFLYFSWFHTFESFSEAAYSSVFHSISAFCNAGFSLNPDSLTSFSTNYGVILTIGFLVILGGLGFPVLVNVLHIPLLQKVKEKTKIKAYNLHTKLTVTVTVILLITGFIFILFAEWNHALKYFTAPQKILNSFFQSVTSRTAGFSTLPMISFNPATFTLIILLMYMGASPGSTGGGIKTTTVGILFASVFSVLRGRKTIDVFHREIPSNLFNRTIVVIAVSSIFIIIAFLILQLTNDLPFKESIFEIFSAFGTVGLSTGVITQLNNWGKFIFIICMFFGRIGVFTIALAIMRPHDKTSYSYPRANVMIG